MCTFHCDFFLMILRSMKGILVFLYWETIILFEKGVEASHSLDSEWVSSAVFGWYVQIHQVPKHALPPFHLIHRYVLFLTRWRISTFYDRFLVGDHLFFLSLFFLFFFKRKCIFVLFSLDLSFSALLLFYCRPLSYYKTLVVFNSVIEL